MTGNRDLTSDSPSWRGTLESYLLNHKVRRFRVSQMAEPRSHEAPEQREMGSGGWVLSRSVGLYIFPCARKCMENSYCMDFNQHPCFCPLFSVACNKTLFQTFCLHFNIDTTKCTDINFHELCPQWQQMLHSCSNSPEPKNIWEHVHLCTLTADSEYFWLKLLVKSLTFLLLL